MRLSKEEAKQFIEKNHDGLLRRLAESEKGDSMVKSVIEKFLEDRGLPPVNISPEALVLDVVDSISLAIIVMELEELTGLDPFEAGFIGFRTVGELEKLFEKV